MKKLVYLAIFTVTTQAFAFDTDKVEEAIDQSLFEQVKAQCKKIDRDEDLTSPARKKIYRNLYDLANDATSLRAENMSPFSNWRDGAKIGSGVLLSGVGVLSIFLGLVAFERKNARGVRLMLYGGFIEGYAAYLFYKGLTCSTQKANLEAAKSIEKYLKGKLNAEESAAE